MKVRWYALARSDGGDDDRRSLARGPTSVTATNDELFDLLSNWRRRFVVRLISMVDRDDYLTLDSLTRQLMLLETGADHPDDVGAQARKRVYISLYQWHLPRLDDAGLVDHDGDRNVIRPTDDTRPVGDWLRMWAAATGGDPPDPETYRGRGDHDVDRRTTSHDPTPTTADGGGEPQEAGNP